MRYWNYEDGLSLWMDLDSEDRVWAYAGGEPQTLVLKDAGLDGLLHPTSPPVTTKRNVDKFRYALAADYIEENWDRLLSIAETAEGVDPKPLLERLLSRLRAEWQQSLEGVGKC